MFTTRSVSFVSFLALTLSACGLSSGDSTTDTGGSDQSGEYVWGSGGGSASSSSDATADTACLYTADSGDASDDVEDSGDSADSADTAACVEITWYADSDSDGYGDATKSILSCDQPNGYVSNGSDLDDDLAVVGNNPIHAQICATVDIDAEFAFWWDDIGMTESNTWLSTTLTDTTAACEDVDDFRPTHWFALNGYYKGDGGEDEWLVGAGGTSHITIVYVIFDDGSHDAYEVDETGVNTDVGYAYFVDNGDGGGNLYFEAEPDFVGENSH